MAVFVLLRRLLAALDRWRSRLIGGVARETRTSEPVWSRCAWKRQPRRLNCEYSPSTISTATCSRRRAASGSRSRGQNQAHRGAGRRGRAHGDAGQAAARRSKEHDVRRRRRPDRRQPVTVGDVSRRADHRIAVDDGPGGRLGRQSRIRRRQGRTAADAEWRLPSDRRMPGAAPFAGAKFRYLAASTIEKSYRQDLVSSLRDQGVRGHPRRLHRPDAEGHARTSSRRRASPVSNSATRPTPSTRWCRK